MARIWERFIVNDKFYKERVKYEKLQKDVDRNGKTPLHKAAENGQFLKFKMIFDHVEDKNPEDYYHGYGRPYDHHWVAGNWHYTQVKLTPFQLAAQNGH